LKDEKPPQLSTFVSLPH